MGDQYPTTAHFNRYDVSIRAMEHADLAVVVELDALVFGVMRSAYFERRLAALNEHDADARMAFLVADYQGAVIGFVMGTLAYGEFGLTQVTAILDSIAVHPGYQQQGIGRQLIESFIKQGTLQGAAAVYTLVNWDNWTLLKVFHALGFVLASTIPLERRID
ncbi:MAG TPA: GNAT family N-acetyltransferase [Ktedonobacteraceae bacterium]|nr:GNAT family N-acetyltransferase [Ktedonobacteraceae bacterium]